MRTKPRGLIRFLVRRVPPTLVVLWLALANLAGCGNAMYALSVTRASDEVARAEQLDAAGKAPYEYYYALEHLRKARSEAVEADYADAIALAETAYHFAARAIQRAQRVEPLITSVEAAPP